MTLPLAVLLHHDTTQGMGVNSLSGSGVGGLYGPAPRVNTEPGAVTVRVTVTVGAASALQLCGLVCHT